MMKARVAKVAKGPVPRMRALGRKKKGVRRVRKKKRKGLEREEERRGQSGQSAEDLSTGRKSTDGHTQLGRQIWSR